MYYGNADQGAQRWHWGNAAPNSHSSVGDPHLETEVVWTVEEQRELHEAAWRLLKKYGVIVPRSTTSYWVSMQLAAEISALRDKQLDRRRDA